MKTKEFQSNIRRYNGVLSFTLLGIDLDERYSNKNIATYKTSSGMSMSRNTQTRTRKHDFQWVHVYDILFQLKLSLCS